MRFTFFILSLMTLISSCDYLHCPNKDAFLDSYETFVLKVEQKRLDGSNEWENEEKIFKDYANRCYDEYKSDFTSEDKSRFWTSTLKYYYNRFNGNINEAFKNAEQELSEDFKKDLNFMLENGDDEIIKIAKDLFSEDIKRGVDGVLEVLNDLGDKIKESLEESEK